jgi:hypothetical protein
LRHCCRQPSANLPACLLLVSARRFWDLASLQCVRKAEGHADAVRVLSAVDGKVISGAYDGAVGVW